MNVLFVNKVSPELGGGAEARILEVGKRLSERGCNVYVVCAITEPDLPSFKRIDGIEVMLTRTCPRSMFGKGDLGFYASRIFFYLLPITKLATIIAENNIEVIVQDVSPTLNPWVSKIAKRRNIPLVYSIHEVFEDIFSWVRFYGAFGLWGYLFEERIRQRRTDYQRIITVAEWVRASLARDIPESIIDVITNGVDLDRFKPTEKSENGTIHMLNVGRFVPHKGHIFLLRAIRTLLSTQSDLTLHLVGSGPLLPQLRKKSDELGISGNVTFHGYVTDAQLLDLYSIADVFVLPSIYEGFPVVIPEAMAMGLPIVSTRIPAIKGILNERNAVIVEPANPRALAQGILDIIGDEELRNKLSKIGRDQALARFDWEVITDLYLTTLSSVVR